jgi:hypothetical protein
MSDALGRQSGEVPSPLWATPSLNSEIEHSAGKREVEMYVRTYRSMLRSSGDVPVKALIQAHLSIDSALHPEARSSDPDMSAFIYSMLRLPPEILRSAHVLLGQSDEVFRQQGYPIDQWQTVTASARRRRWYYDGKQTLAVYIASETDVDDIVPTMVALQIEWNKLHWLLNIDPTTMQLLESRVDRSSPVFAEMTKVVRERLRLSSEDWRRLELMWGDLLWPNLLIIGRDRKNMTLRMLGGSYVDIARTARRWWGPIEKLLADLRLEKRPVYFLSSNMHSLANLLGGMPVRRQDELTRFALSGADPFLAEECRKLKEGSSPGNWQNFLYYVAREYSRTPAGRDYVRARPADEQERGIWSVPARQGMEIDAQVIDLARVRPGEVDERCRISGMDRLAESRAVILNIDYPLGIAAYRVLREVMTNIDEVRGIYILGKAATLNASIGDVMISNVVLDEHSQNSYWLDNCFNAGDISRFLVFGSVLDNQRAVSSKGTFLQNRQYLDFYYANNFTVIEMETGPYLDAVYEDIFSTRYPIGESINFAKMPFDVGILHYASDTPYTRGRNLGAGSLSYYGMDSTYAAAVAIARRILDREIALAARSPAGGQRGAAPGQIDPNSPVSTGVLRASRIIGRPDQPSPVPNPPPGRMPS